MNGLKSKEEKPSEKNAADNMVCCYVNARTAESPNVGGNFTEYYRFQTMIIKCFLVFILLGIYSCHSKQSAIVLNSSEKVDWIKSIINSSNYLKSIDSTDAELIANCSVEKLIAKYNREEINKIGDLFINDKDSAARLLGPIIEPCIEPYLDKIEDEQDISDCVKAATKKGNINEAEAKKSCKCFLTYIKTKYSKAQLKNIDSIVQTEKDKARECLIEAKE